MKIYFCEKCGVSIPLQEVVGGRATARDGKTYCRTCQPSGDGGGDLKLYFCDNCRVSIPLQDVITNRAKAVGEQMLCVDCGRLSSPQRNARKERIQRELKEREESRYRLHFCDSCNTSIPQSHLITGRAVLKGGRTFCERCRGRAEGRRVSAFATVSVVLLLGVVFFAGYMILGSGGGLLAGEAAKKSDAPDPFEALSKRLDELDRLRTEREAQVETLKEGLADLPALRDSLGKLRDLAGDNSEHAEEILKAQSSFKLETEDRLARIDALVRQLDERLGALAARLEDLKVAGPPPPVRPEPEQPPAAEPEKPAPREEPPAAEPIPPEVEALLKDLENDDAGMRFAAAVELGKKGHKAAVDPLIRVLTKDRDVFVRRAATRSLGELNAWKAVPALIDALEDKEFFVAITAHKAIETITGQDFGFKEQLSRSEVRRIVQKAKNWWEEHQGDRTE